MTTPISFTPMAPESLIFTTTSPDALGGDEVEIASYHGGGFIQIAQRHPSGFHAIASAFLTPDEIDAMINQLLAIKEGLA